MLQISDLTYRIEGRLILDGASAAVPAGHKVGLVGRNGSGKTTLLGLIAGDLTPHGGAVAVPRDARIGRVAQEAPDGPTTLIDHVLAADAERSRLMAEAAVTRDPERIAEIQLRLADIRAHDAPARAATILAGLGFDEPAQHRPLGAYSGGWRMRVALAALLFSEPDLLLLDEPTNYLDLEGALWLESFLRRYRRTVVIVSHDRDLLNSAVDAILHLDQHRLTLYSGGFDAFERQRRERQSLQLKLRKRQDAERRHMEAFVERFRAKATKARQAQSRIKALERMEPIPDIVAERFRPFHFPSPTKALPPPLINLENVAAGYGADTVVLRGVTLRLDPDDRIGLLGANGNGKSTFARLLAGRLEPMSGTLRADRRMSVGYFAQHQLDELDGGRTPYEHFRERMEGESEARIRARLGASGFGAETADTQAAALSGGEKARLLFALATFSGPHLLILDEPTNHLDIESREALVHALNDYDGAVIVISHDRHLLDAVADRLWLVAGGTVRAYDGDIDSYRAELLQARRVSNGDAVKSGGDGGSGGAAAERRREAARQRREAAPLRRAVEAAEKRIDGLRRDLEALDRRLADGAIYERDPDLAAALARARARTEEALGEAEEDWLAAAESYEAAKNSAA